MAKTKGRPRKPSGEGTLVRIDSDIVSRARYLSAQHDIPMSELLSDILRPEIDRRFSKATREVLEAEQKAMDEAAALEQGSKGGDGSGAKKGKGSPK